MKEDKDNIILLCKKCSAKGLKQFQRTFDKDKVKVGDFIKKGFEDNGEVEHLWVEIKEICDDCFKGHINNEVVILKNLKFRDYVKVKFSEVEEESIR